MGLSQNKFIFHPLFENHGWVLISDNIAGVVESQQYN